MAGSLQAIILQLRDDIGTLSKYIQDKKDEKINASVKQLKQSNENLIANRIVLENKIESQLVLIAALQKGIDANMSLNEKYKSDMSACLGSNEILKIELDSLTAKLTAAEMAVASKQKLANELASLRSKTDGDIFELRKEIESNTNLCEKFKIDLAASLESNKQLKIEMECMGGKLAEAENEITSNKTELQKLTNENKSIKEKYHNTISELESSVKSNQQLHFEVERLGRKLAVAEKAVTSNISSGNELEYLRRKSEAIVAELQSEIECLVKDNSASLKENEKLKLALKKHTDLVKSTVTTQSNESEVCLIHVLFLHPFYS